MAEDYSHEGTPSAELRRATYRRMSQDLSDFINRIDGALDVVEGMKQEQPGYSTAELLALRAVKQDLKGAYDLLCLNARQTVYHPEELKA